MVAAATSSSQNSDLEGSAAMQTTVETSLMQPWAAESFSMAAGSRTTMNSMGWVLRPDGARRPASRMRSRSPSGMSVGLRLRTDARFAILQRFDQGKGRLPVADLAERPRRPPADNVLWVLQ